MTNEEFLRKSNIDHIKKVIKRADAKRAGWPGAPLSHFSVTGPEIEVLRKQIADGSLRVVDRPKANPKYTATFVCLPEVAA